MLEEQVWCHSFIKVDPVGEVTRLTASDPNYFISSGSLVEITFILGEPQRLVIYYSICHYGLAHMTNILRASCANHKFAFFVSLWKLQTNGRFGNSIRVTVPSLAR